MPRQNPGKTLIYQISSKRENFFAIERILMHRENRSKAFGRFFVVSSANQTNDFFDRSSL